MFYPSLIGSAVANSAQAGAARVTAQDAQRKAASAEEKVEVIKSDIERLLMITEALWMILKKEGGYADADLTSLITEIDLRDGRLDGHVAGGPRSRAPIVHTSSAESVRFASTAASLSRSSRLRGKY